MNTTIIIRQKLLDSSRHNCWFGLTNIAKGFNVLKFGSSNIIAVLLFITLALVSERSIAQITTGFELDGNANAVLPNPPDDWDLIYNNTSSAQVTTGVVNDVSSSADNRFTVGSKDQGNINTWHWDIASVPDKDDLLHAGAALYDGNKIYFFGDRFAINGDAQIGFWLFKNAITTNPDGSFNGVHAIGDILLLSNFVNGGGVPVIKAYEWVGSGGSDGTLNLIPVSGSNLYAITNSSVVASPWPYQEKDGTPANFFPVGGFYEGGIDLAGLGFGIDPCFSAFLMETRSSSSVSAELKDFMLGNFFTKPQVSVNSPNMCLNGNPVTLTATVQGGVSPFSYLWAPGGATTSSITVSPSVTTTYTVTVTAANGCVANPATGTVTVNPSPACSIGDPNPPLAVVICNTPGNTISTSSAIDLNLFTLSWSITPSQAGMTGWTITSGQGTNSIVFTSGLCGSAGSSVDVALTVTDKSSGCVSTCHKTILPTAPQCGASINPHDSLDCIITQVSLTGVANSDNPNPILLWTASNGGHIVSGASTLTVVVDAPGTYTFSVTDAINGCNAFAITTVTQNITTPVLSETHTDVSCNGLSNGSIDLTVSGGKAPYTYLWSTGATTQDINGLAAGSYSVTVTGANGCISTRTIVITEPPVLVLSTQKTDVLCNGGSTGSITASASGGTPPYQFSINAGAFGSNNVFNGLAAGTYTIHVKDAHGCEKTASVTIAEPTLVVLSTQKTDVLCNGESTGSITASATGGVAPYQFSIDAGSFGSNNVFSNLAAGTYTIHVKDANGCEKTLSVTINQPALVILSATKTDVLCNGESTGSITANVSGGVPPYLFSINSGAFGSNNVFSNLAAGVYTIHVKDAYSCEKTTAVTITQPSLVVLSVNKTDVLCNGETTGTITASATGGVTPYVFAINGGAYSSNNLFDNLAAGNYSIHVKDANGCIKTTEVTISEPPLLVLSTQKTDVLCFGLSTGIISASATGGVGPYLFSLGGAVFVSSGVFNNLPAGTYTVYVKDANGCQKKTDVTITQPPSVKCLLTAPDPSPVCGSTGNILTAEVSNAISYTWTVNGDGWSITGGQGSSSITYTAGKDSATFTLVVANTNDCKDTCMVTFGVGSCVRLVPFCTLTQGFYGQSKGISCATGERSLALITRLLGAPFGNLVIGKPGHSLTLMQSFANCVILRMPSGGPSVVLPAGNLLFDASCNISIPLNNNGRFNNTLLGQTIALGLNMRLDTDLGAFVIPGTSFTTMGALPGIDGKCGTEDDIPVFTSLLTETIPQSVLTAMNSLYSSASVYNLFDLANRALGGLSTGGATLKEINAAVSAINEGFDGCRFIEVNAKKITSTGKPKGDKANTIVSKAYPNPFAYSSTIEFTTKKDAVVTVTVYTITGTKIADLFSGEVKADEVKQVIFKGESLPNGIYIYRITSGDKVYFDRLVLQK